MSIRSMMAAGAAGLAIATGAGSSNSLHAQNAAADFRADSAFVNQVAASNLLEVRLGQMAEKKASAPAVRQFGAKMRTDHTAQQQEWMTAAKQHNYPFRASWTLQQSQVVGRLNELSGADFDRAYMEQMVQDHYNNINAFQSARRGARSAVVRSLADKGLPVLQQHHTLATQVRAQVNGEVAVASNDTTTTQQQQGGAQPTTPWGNVKPEVKQNPDSARAQQPTPQPSTGQQPTTTSQQPTTVTPVSARARADFKADAKFVREIAADHKLERDLGELALRKAQHEQVKRYAQQMVKDHGWMQERWVSMAARNGRPITPSYGKNHRAKLTKLEKKSGADFDRAYMSMMVENHKDYLDYFNKEGRAARSADVRDMVNRETRVLEEHFNWAKQVGAMVGADTTAQLRVTQR